MEIPGAFSESANKAAAVLRELVNAIKDETSIDMIRSLIGKYKQCLGNMISSPLQQVEQEPLRRAVLAYSANRAFVVEEVATSFSYCLVDFLKTAAEMPRIDLTVLSTLLGCAKLQIGWAIRDGNRAIHFAAKHCDCVEAIRLWIAACPDGLSVGNATRELPLHCAAYYNTNVDVVRALCAANPKALCAEDTKGRIPLSFAAHSPNSTENVLVLLEADPEGARSRDKSGRHPLHHAMTSTMTEKSICALISACPEAARTADGAGNLPLHIAAQRCGSVDAFCALIAANPDGASVRNQDGNLPIHCAVACSVSADVVRVLIAAHREGLSTWNDCGQLPIHIAATSSTSVDVVRVLINGFPKSLSMGGCNRLPLHLCAGTFSSNSGNVEKFHELLVSFPQAVCARNRKELSIFELKLPSTAVDMVKEYFPSVPFGERSPHVCPLKLHSAVQYGSAKVVRAMLRVVGESKDKGDAAALDKCGLLPLHYAAMCGEALEEARLILDAYPDGAYIKDKNGCVPLQLTSTRTSTDMVLLFLHQSPELAKIRDKLSNPNLAELWRAYAKSFTPSQTDISNFHIHICGEPFAGKSVVFHWVSNILKQNRSVTARVGDALSLLATHFEIKPDDRRATRGTVTETVPYITKNGRSLHCIVRDYGGQAQFKLTHAPLLACPASIYSIVLPLFDRSSHQGKWYTVEELTDHLKDWLRMIYSVIYNDGSGGAADEDNSLTSNRAVPILVVINKFSAFPNPSKTPISLSDIQQMIADVKLYFCERAGDEVKEVFRFFEPVMIDACHKKDVYKLEDPLIQASELVAASQQYARYHCVDFLLSHLPAWSGLLVLEPDVLKELEKVFIQHNYQQFATMRSADRSISEYLVSGNPTQRLAEICLKILIEMHHFLVLNTGFQQVGSRIIVTDPNWLTNKVVGEVLHKSAERSTKGMHGQVPLVYSREELDAMVPDLPPGVTVDMVLETLGLAMPVNIGPSNEILPVVSYHESVMFLLGLVETPMPEVVKQSCQQLSLDTLSGSSSCSSKILFTALSTNEHCGDRLVRSASRLFTLQNNRCCFIPGFFMKLFMFIHNKNPCPERFWYWKDGMVTKCIVRWKVKNGTDMEGRKLISLYPFNDRNREGFVVSISIWMNDSCVSPVPMNKWDGFFHPCDIVLDELDKIRTFIFSTEHWNISVDEYVLQGESAPPMLVSDAEVSWFGGEQSRMMRIRPCLIGNFSDYNSLIRFESKLNLLLMSSSANKKQHDGALVCTWSGVMSELITKLRAQWGEDTSGKKELLVVWILRHFRSSCMKLSAGKCDAIVRKVWSKDAADSTLDYDSDADEAEDLTDSERVLQAINSVQENLNLQMRRYVEDSRRIHIFPLLAVMSRYQPSTVLGHCKMRANAAIGITTYRVHFLCCVCGCRNTTAGQSYKLNLGTDGTESVLEIVQLSLAFLEVMLQLGGVPNQISVIADLAVSSLDILTTDLRNDLLKIADEQDVDNQHFLFKSKSQPPTSNPSSPYKASPALLDPTKKALRSEKVVTKKHIDSMEKLFKEQFNDPTAGNSGLEKAIRDNGEAAWVCGSEGGAKSCCYREFMNKGQDCIAVLAKYE